MSETLNIEFITDAYLSDSRSLFWKIKINGFEIANTLRNDDKMWDAHEKALESAKMSFLGWIDGQSSPYFIAEAQDIFSKMLSQ